MYCTTLPEDDNGNGLTSNGDSSNGLNGDGATSDSIYKACNIPTVEEFYKDLQVTSCTCTLSYFKLKLLFKHLLA
jgi:hypothetical protein